MSVIVPTSNKSTQRLKAEGVRFMISQTSTPKIWALRKRQQLKSCAAMDPRLRVHGSVRSYVHGVPS